MTNMKGVISALTLLVNVAISENMNGEYFVASGAKQNVAFNTDYASKGNEYFTIYAPEIATHYGDVYWMSQGVIDLPQDIIDRFAGKVIAITGYEQDQVMVVGEAGENPEKDVSVPINWAYNHHYMLWMTGNYSQMIEIAIDPTDLDDVYGGVNHGLTTKWIAKDLPSAKLRDNPQIPTSQLFSEGNGGESRKSFHGYPDGFAQLIESPQSYHLTPMQIDTRNRECGATINDTNNCTQFIPGIEPLQARYGRAIDPKIGTNYSGLLECPCNGKFGGDPIFYGNNTKTKSVIHNYVTLQTTKCEQGEDILSSQDCFNAIKSIINNNNMTIITKETSSTNIPSGCSITQDINPNTIYAYFNSDASSSTQCSTSNLMSGSTQSTIGTSIKLDIDTKSGDVTFVNSPAGEWCSDNHKNVLAKYPAASNSNSDAQIALEKCQSFCKTSSKCTVCSVDCSLSMTSTSGQCQWVALQECGTIEKYNGPNGLIPGDISWKEEGTINITISGPSNVWFGVGFNAEVMADQPWTIIINSTDVWEQKIGTCGSEAEHCPGTTLNKTITILSNTVNNGIRTVKIKRGLIGANNDYYSFIPSDSSTINLITAIGSSQTFAYHAAHSNMIISTLENSGNTCVCDRGANGKICFDDGTGCKTFVKNCIAASKTTDGVPDGSLLIQDNPTCNSRQYSGGLSCCINGHNLLDADQEIPPQLLKYHMKYRFWFQEYIPENATNPIPSHYNLDRIYQQTEANAGEYDIPPAFSLPNDTSIVGYSGDWPLNKLTPGSHCTGNCPNGIDCECYHEIHYKWIESPNKPMRLIYAGGHCHAPSCISLTLYRNDTGEILCDQIPVMGTGNITHDKFDEAGYIAIPPCLWGNDTGLEPSVLLPAGTPLLSIKKNHNTHQGHFGEMASWQMRGVFF